MRNGQILGSGWENETSFWYVVDDWLIVPAVDSLVQMTVTENDVEKSCKLRVVDVSKHEFGSEKNPWEVWWVKCVVE